MRVGLPDGPLELLCIGAHCDDVEIGCGGSLLRLLDEHPGSRVHWLVLTSTPDRAAEARSAAAAFTAAATKVEVEIGELRDGYLPTQQAQAKDTFEALKGHARPDLILTHRRDDAHQDHRVAAELTWNTFRDHLILEYEIPKYDGDLGRPNVFVPLDESTVARKLELLRTHYPSQRERRWFEDETFRSLLRLRGMECNAPDRYAEGFLGTKVVL